MQRKYVLNYILLFFISLLFSCVTVPPIFVYNRGYANTGFQMPKAMTEQRKVILNIVVKKDSASVGNNNRRYVLGSLSMRLKNLFYKKSEKRNPKFDVQISGQEMSDVDYNVVVSYEGYGRGDSVTMNQTVVDSVLSKGPEECFSINVEFKNPKNQNDQYVYFSNGCPGINDYRLIADGIFKVLVSDILPYDGSRTNVLNISGASPESWFSSLVSDPEVDKVLGYL